MSDTRHLKKRRQTWYLQVAVPTDLQSTMGKKVIVRSLKTTSLKEAQYRRIGALAEVHSWFDSARSAPNDWSTPTNILHAAQYARGQIEAGEGAENDVLENWEHGVTEALYRDQVSDEQFNAMQMGRRIIQGEKVSMLSDCIDAHIEEIKSRVIPQTVNARKRRLKQFKDKVKDMAIGALTRRQVGAYVSEVLIPLDRSVKTKQDTLADLKAFGSWCVERGYLESNPFAGQKITDTKRGTIEKTQAKRRAWTDTELKQLMESLPEKGVLRPVTLIGMYSGMRLNEICELEVGNIFADEPVPYFDLVEGKTESSIRRVPIHSEILPLVKTLVEKSRDNYLISGLKPGGENKRRGQSVSKRFGYHVRKHVTEDKRLVFHSLRKSFLEKLEDAGVPINIAESIVGHRRQSMSYGLYSQGVSLQKLATSVRKVKYRI
ncbi:MAG: DUF6538 domain-containing protein [Sedimenticola sp.]